MKVRNGLKSTILLVGIAHTCFLPATLSGRVSRLINEPGDLVILSMFCSNFIYSSFMASKVLYPQISPYIGVSIFAGIALVNLLIAIRTGFYYEHIFDKKPWKICKKVDGQNKEVGFLYSNDARMYSNLAFLRTSMGSSTCNVIIAILGFLNAGGMLRTGVTRFLIPSIAAAFFVCQLNWEECDADCAALMLLYFTIMSGPGALLAFMTSPLSAMPKWLWIIFSILLWVIIGIAIIFEVFILYSSSRPILKRYNLPFYGEMLQQEEIDVYTYIQVPKKIRGLSLFDKCTIKKRNGEIFEDDLKFSRV